MHAESTLFSGDQQYLSVVKRRLLDGLVPSAAGCWLWVGAGIRKGYGCINVRLGKWSYARVLTHRLAYLFYCGPIADGLFVLHRCDTPACCRPEHLFLGTMQENSDDMVAKGRHVPVRGERSRHAKLTEADVLEIRRLYVAGTPYYPGNCEELCTRFGIRPPTLYDILARKKWKHLR